MAKNTLSSLIVIYVGALIICLLVSAMAYLRGWYVDAWNVLVFGLMCFLGSLIGAIVILVAGAVYNIFRSK